MVGGSKQWYWWTGTFSVLEISQPQSSLPPMPYEYAVFTSCSRFSHMT